MRSRLILPVALAAAAALSLAGCSAGAGGTPTGRIAVVASTDVWGDVARQIGGTQVTVDSIITDPNRDPHDYQADPRDQLAVSRARLVVENGGGYDDFIGQMLKSAPSGTAVVDAADVSGLDQHPRNGDFNEHLWYDYPVVSNVAGAVAARLTRLDPAHRAAFASRLAAFRAKLAGLESQVAAIRSVVRGEGVAITEPVPLYLTSALGLVNRTPQPFSAAIENGTDVAPSVLQQQLALFSGHRVALLAYNEQTTSATTTQVLAAAKRAGVPIVGVRETLPDGQGYLAWMQQDLTEMKTALER